MANDPERLSKLHSAECLCYTALSILVTVSVVAMAAMWAGTVLGWISYRWIRIACVAEAVVMFVIAGYLVCAKVRYCQRD